MTTGPDETVELLISRREAATIKAALYQWRLTTNRDEDDELTSIANAEGAVEPLTDAEIDELILTRFENKAPGELVQIVVEFPSGFSGWYRHLKTDGDPETSSRRGRADVLTRSDAEDVVSALRKDRPDLTLRIVPLHEKG